MLDKSFSVISLFHAVAAPTASKGAIHGIYIYKRCAARMYQAYGNFSSQRLVSFFSLGCILYGLAVGYGFANTHSPSFSYVVASAVHLTFVLFLLFTLKQQSLVSLQIGNIILFLLGSRRP